MIIYAIRHLPTPWNEKGVLQGSKDISISPPTQEVLEEINAVVLESNIRNIEFDGIFCSPLKRTLETGRLYGFNPTIEPLIKEINFRSFEGLPKKTLIEVSENKWISSPTNSILKMEVLELKNQIETFLLKFDGKGKKYLIFSHGAFIRGLTAIVKNNNIDLMNSFHIGNNEMVILRYNEEGISN